MLENAALYHSLVQRFQPPRSSHSKTSSKRNDRLVVAARLRPVLGLDCPVECLTCTYPRQDSQTILDVHELQNRPRWGPALRSSSFETDRIFAASETNKQIFDELMTPLIDVALTGGIATLFAYGQTGSGKTYTINGLAKLTAEALAQSQATHHISVCAIEIIGSSIYGNALQFS